MTNADYWAQRQALLMYDRLEEAEAVSAEIAEIYYHASRTIAHELESIFRGFRSRFGLSDRDARRILNLMKDPGDMAELKRALASIDHGLLAWLEAPAVQQRLQRLQELQGRVLDVSRDIYRQDLSLQRRWYTRLGRDTYYHTIYSVQREVGFQFSFAHIDDKVIRKVMNSRWGGQGRTFSERLWSNVEGVTKEIRKQLTLGILTGKTEKKMADEIANKYATGAFESRRLVRTESCYLSNEIQFEAYKECGAERYQYVATLDARTDEECGSLDRKTFYIKDKRPGINCPPMHPFCRCTTKIYIDQDARDDMKRRARVPGKGKTYLVPASTSYEKWAKDNGIR